MPGRAGGGGAALVVLSLLVLMPFQWIVLAEPGGFSVRLPFLPLMLAMVLAVALLPLRAGGLRMAQATAPGLLPYLFYLLAILPGFFGSAAQGSPVRQAFFMAGAVALGGCVAMLPQPRKVLRLGGAACLLGFLAITEMIGRQFGTSWAEAVRKFASGDLNFVVYGFMRNIFNAGGEGRDIMLVASEKNAVSAALFVGLVLFRAAGPKGRADRIGMAMTVLAAGVLLMLNTRSVLLPLVLGLLLAGILPALRPRSNDPTRLLLLLVLGLLVLGLAIPVLISTQPLTQMLSARFSLGDASSASRLTQLSFAIQHIENAILTGNGYIQIDGHPVHNLFLGSFLHGGLAAFLMVLGFYLWLLLSWARLVFLIARAPGLWLLPLRPEWVAVLPLLPLVRVWLTGDSGHPALAEWVALALFFGLRLANRACLARALRPARPDAGEAAAPGPSPRLPPAAGLPGSASAPA